MKRSKKTLLILLGVITLVLAGGILCVGLKVAPTVNHALRISELLQPVTDANNQTMHIAVSAEFGSNDLSVESDVYMVTENDASYLVLEQNSNAVYISGNVLFLENGKAFKLGEKIQAQTAAHGNLLPQIGALYDILKITAEEMENAVAYEITVTGNQMDTLLAAVSFGEALPVDGVQKLNLCLTEKNGKLEQIRFFGIGNLDGTTVELDVTISGFRILASGDYPIPDAVKQAAATVDPEELFSLTEDLYRLVLALAPLADSSSLDGTLALTVDCGPLQLDTRMALSDLKTASNSQMEPDKLKALPEVLGLWCMEGDLSCTNEGSAYVYRLVLEQPAMQELARMILPELAQYGGILTEGEVSIRLENNAIASMKVSLEGKVSALLVQIPVIVGAEFIFD